MEARCSIAELIIRALSPVMTLRTCARPSNGPSSTRRTVIPVTDWTSLKSNLRNCSALERLVSQQSNVNHVTGRSGGCLRTPGPVLMAWADMEGIGQLTQLGRHRARTLCVIAWNENAIRPWVSAVQPVILGDSSGWEELTPELDPVIIEAMKSLTLTVNHNNTILAGFEKDMVVSSLLALSDAGIRLHGEAMQG